MTLAAIKSMFAVGQKWKCSREGLSLGVHGNTGPVLLPAVNVADEIRTVKATKSAEWVFDREGHARPIYTKHPKASEVLEAREGFLKFRYDNGVTVTLEKIS